MVHSIKDDPDIMIRDLYREYPDWNIDTQREQQLLLEADRIVFQFPFYWYSAPALLKQWMEKTFTGDFGAGSEKLKAKSSWCPPQQVGLKKPIVPEPTTGLQ